ncbi:MAG: hypothetical protein N3B21_12980 [Clostridia bacterium]|nr:hypothetical protein [Clostridia bacterium]
MLKRILAWMTLAGFILLILNLLVFRYQPTLSLTVYLAIVVAFIFWGKKQDKK